MKVIAPFLTATLLAAVPGALNAAVLSVQPSPPSVPVGGTVEVAVTVSGLGAGAPPSLSVFDLDLSYDPGVLQFDSLTFGDPGLGDQLDLSGSGSLTGSDSTLAGVVNHFELSLDPVLTLDSLQPAAFTLSILRFTALSPGVSSLDLIVNALGDASGDPLAASVESASVTVVPEPSATSVLLALGAVVWVGVLRRKALS